MEDEQTLFTCMSCSIAFTSPEEQSKLAQHLAEESTYLPPIYLGTHYRSDHHRYNMKRRVAGLPPVSATVFNQKVLERRAETAVMVSPKGSTCEVCNKVYTTENAYRSHLTSKKHKENEQKAVAKPSQPILDTPSATEQLQDPPREIPKEQVKPTPPTKPAPSLSVPENATEEEITRTIDERIAAARARLSPSDCLFCPTASPSLEQNLTHMSLIHSFFIPEAEYLIDLPGLITYLGEKIAVGNVCLYCNGKGREFRSMDAVRKHMIDKSHCKIAYYESERDQLELGDYYDFTSSYPDPVSKSSKSKSKDEEGEWEDISDDGSANADDIVDIDGSDATAPSNSDSEVLDDIPPSQLAFGDSHLELVLPSGARIGHRSMKRYYAQSYLSHLPSSTEDGNEAKSGAALVRRLLADKNSALVPRKGGFGAFGMGTQVVKARNPGEAREAGRHTREFRDMRKREEFKTKMGFINNSQKHFRDPLLQ